MRKLKRSFTIEERKARLLESAQLEQELSIEVGTDINLCEECGCFYPATNECPRCGSTHNSLAGSVIPCDEEEDFEEFEYEEVEVFVVDVEDVEDEEVINEAKGCKKKLNESDDEESKEEAIATIKELCKTYGITAKEITDILSEATKKVVRGGEVVTVKVKKKKEKLSAKQKQALAKARKKSNTAAAQKQRAKSMKIRKAKLGESRTLVINESYNARLKPGIVLVSESVKNPHIVARQLGFRPTTQSDRFEKRINEHKLVLEECSGDMKGLAIYGVDSRGQHISEHKLHQLIKVHGLNIEL